MKKINLDHGKRAQQNSFARPSTSGSFSGGRNALLSGTAIGACVGLIAMGLGTSYFFARDSRPKESLIVEKILPAVGQSEPDFKASLPAIRSGAKSVSQTRKERESNTVILESNSKPSEEKLRESDPTDLAANLELLNRQAVTTLLANRARYAREAQSEMEQARQYALSHPNRKPATFTIAVNDTNPSQQQVAAIQRVSTDFTPLKNNGQQACNPRPPAIMDPQCRTNYACPICGGCCCLCEAVRMGLASAPNITPGGGIINLRAIMGRP